MMHVHPHDPLAGLLLFVKKDTSHHDERHSRVTLFARLHADTRAFWCLGPAHYLSHSGDRPIDFDWRLDVP